MPPRPFPYALNVGTDIVSVKRIRALLERKILNDPVESFTRKLFTEYERLTFSARFQDQLRDARGGQVSELVCKHLAGRWVCDSGAIVKLLLMNIQAAKEAIIKACRWRSLSFQDISIARNKTRPDIYGVIHDEVHKLSPGNNKSSIIRKHIAKEETDPDRYASHSGQIVEVSISHEEEYATAVCLCPSQPSGKDVGGEAEARGYR